MAPRLGVRGMMPFFVAIGASSARAFGPTGTKPHVLFILVDDLGQYPWLMLDLRFCYITCAAVVVTVYWPSNPRHEIIYTTGHAELGFNREVKTKEVQTPSIDQLVSDGIKLDRHYVHKFCSPTRCSIQSGRAPIHVNVRAP